MRCRRTSRCVRSTPLVWRRAPLVWSRCRTRRRCPQRWPKPASRACRSSASATAAMCCSSVTFRVSYFDRRRLASRCLGMTARSGDVRAEAAVGWDGFVDWSIAKGFAGLENLALIPGRVGAAPIQNIGAYGTEIDEFVTAVEAWDRSTGRTVTARARVTVASPTATAGSSARSTAGSSPRSSSGCRGGASRVSTIPVCEQSSDQLPATSPRRSEIAAAIRRIRRRKLPDPAVIGNAGSFFKNPIVPTDVAQNLIAVESRPAELCNGRARPP